MAVSKMSAKGNYTPGDGALWHNGTTAYVSTKSGTAMVTGTGNDVESGYDACVVWDDTSTQDQVLGAIERIKAAIIEHGVGF